MRRPVGIHWGILALAVTFIVGGIYMTVHPGESVVFHQAYRWAHSATEHVSRNETRGYGVLAITVGIVLVGIVFYGRNEDAE